VTTPGMTSVDAPGMVAAQSTIQNALDTAQSQYSNMLEQQSTLAANWTGETASAFGQALSAWLSDFQTVINALQSMLTVMAQNTGVYNTTQDTNQQVASTVVNSTQSLAGNLGLPALG
jgi:WXG100 family type VII secretion target